MSLTLEERSDGCWMPDNKRPNALVGEMLSYVATVRPDLPEEVRERQRQVLSNFRTREFEHFNKRLLCKWKRGLLFEALARRDPPYPKMSEDERQTADYLMDALRRDLFGIIDFESSHSHPDDIIVEVKDGIATLLAIVETKLDPFHKRVREQLGKFRGSLFAIVQAINLRLENGLALPSTPLRTRLPKEVQRLQVSPDLEQVLYVPQGAKVSETPNWHIIESPFNYNEVRVIEAFLWHIGRPDK